MENIKKVITEKVSEDHEYVVSLRRHFHRNPEVSLKEFETAKRIEEELHSLGIDTTRVGDTGVYGEIKGELEGNKTIILRADIDALPIKEVSDCPFRSENDGVMHACGHDSHIASLIGAARILSQNKSLFGGTVRLIFQQAEEVGVGGRLFVNGGYLENADRALGIHITPAYDCGQMVIGEGPSHAAVDWFRITVNGVAAHVSTPEKGVDALYIASQIVVAIQALITRLSSPMENLLVGIGKLEAGEAYNIVAPKATMEGTIRSFSPALRQQTKDKIEEVCHNISAIYGGTVNIEWKDNTSPLINNSMVTSEVQKVAKEVYGEDKVVTKLIPSLAGDDFAEFLLKVPGTYVQFGTRNPERSETGLPLHNEKLDIDEDMMLYSVGLYCCYAIAFLNNIVG